MNGYFFRLAQQTGLRRQPQPNDAQGKRGGTVLPRAASSTEPRQSLKPLHQEETVFVSEPRAQDSSQASRQSHDSNAPLPLKKQAVETSPREHDFSTHAARNFSARDSQRTSSEFQESATDAGRKDRLAPDASNADARLQVQDARVRIEQPATPHETFRHQEQAQTLQLSEADEQSAASSLSDEAKAAPAVVEASESLVKTEPEHFKETASLLESGVMDKELLQKVFFREIHEWIAAPVETVAQTESREPPALEENRQRVSLIEPDANAAQLFRAQAREKERLEQHDLSLSIGNISIVIEEPQTQAQPQPVQPAPRAEPSRSQGSREFSRLSRHYIR